MAEPQRQLEVSRVETSDIGERFMWGVVGLCVVVLVSCALLVAWLYPRSSSDRLIALPLPNFPAPQLQTDPAGDMRAFRERQLRQLNGARVPIDEAMRQVAAEGIGSWPSP